MFLSGAAALVYQVVWVRLLGLSLGSTSASISTVLAAFFAGLALGSFGSRWLRSKSGRDFGIYGWLELAIAACGVLSIPLFVDLGRTLAATPFATGGLGMRFVFVFGLLCIPTACMGATFPVMSSAVLRSRQSLGDVIAGLYAFNTLGAMLGALATAYWLVPNFGLDGAVYCAAGLNVSVAALAWKAQASMDSAPSESEATTREPSASGDDSLRPLAYALITFTGLVSLAVEVAWSKALSIFLGSTLVGVATMLAIFLAGIAIGSFLLRTFKAESKSTLLGALLVSLGLSLVLTRAGFAALPGLNEWIAGSTGSPALWKPLVVLVLLIGPTTILGALFPLCLSLCSQGAADTKRAIGSAYALNTVAGIVGSLAAGFWLIPRWGTDFVLVQCALFASLLPLLLVMQLRTTAHRIAVGGGALALFGLGALLPGLDYEELIDSVDYRYDEQASAGQEPNFLFLREGKAGVISLVTYDGVVARLQNNGLNESELLMGEGERGLAAETLLGLVPYLVHPHPQSAFVVGFGGGNTTSALTKTDLERIHVVELEPAIIEAVRFLKTGQHPGLSDPRVQLDIGDARHQLLIAEERYDIIVSQPSHPWLAGAGNLFTVEFFKLVQSRLKDDGIYGQWVNLFNMDTTTLSSILHSFYSVFPHGFTMASLDSGDLLLFGSDSELRFDMELIALQLENRPLRHRLILCDVIIPEDILGYFALSRAEVIQATENASLNTDLTILSEVRLASGRVDPEGEEDPYAFLRAAHHFDVTPYLEDRRAAHTLLVVGGRSVDRWHDFELAQRIIDQLDRLDSDRAAKLRSRLEEAKARPVDEEGE